MGLVKDCLDVMFDAHKDAVRASNQPYVVHPLGVARIYRSVCPDDLVGQGVCLLHDVIEGSSVIVAELSGFFGREVAFMVDALSKRHHSEFRCREDRASEYYGRLFSAARTDKRIALVKLADRYHNISTLDALGYERGVRILDDTERVLIPFFLELGLPLAWELLGLCRQKRAVLTHILVLEKNSLGSPG